MGTPRIVMSIVALALTASAGAVGYWQGGKRAASMASSPGAAEVLSPANKIQVQKLQSPQIASLQEALDLPTDYQRTFALHDLVGRADVEQLKQLAVNAHGIQDPTNRALALSAVYLRFAELDPGAATEDVYRHGSTSRGSALDTIFASWAKQDVEAAVAQAKRISNPSDLDVIARAILRSQGDKDLRVLTDLAKSLARPGLSSGSYVADLLAKKAAVDPLDAMSMAKRLPISDERGRAIGLVAQAWSNVDPWSAYRYADTEENPDVVASLRSTAIYRMAEDDPERALELLDTELTLNEQQILVTTALARVTALDPARGLSLAAELPETHLRLEAMASVYTAWSQVDPRAAASSLESMDNSQLTSRVRWVVATPYARSAPGEALSWAQRLDGVMGETYRTVVNEIAQLDPEAALLSLEKLPASNMREQLQTTALGMMAHRDPVIAITYADEMARGQGRDTALSLIAGAWVERDRDSALEWILTRSHNEQRTLLNNVSYGVAMTDAEWALSFVNRLDGVRRDEWLTNTFHALSYQHKDLALEWLAANRNEPMHDGWLQSVVGTLASTDPRRAVMLLDSIEDPEIAQTARLQIVYQWSVQEPAASAAWVDSLPAEEQDAPLVGTIAGSWSEFDPPAALRWVQKFEPGPLRDAGLGSLINNRQLDAPQIQSLIAQIQDMSLRHQAVQQHAYQLIENNPEAARTFINASDLPDHERQWFLETLASTIGET